MCYIILISLHSIDIDKYFGGRALHGHICAGNTECMQRREVWKPMEAECGTPEPRQTRSKASRNSTLRIRSFARSLDRRNMAPNSPPKLLRSHLESSVRRSSSEGSPESSPNVRRSNSEASPKSPPKIRRSQLGKTVWLDRRGHACAVIPWSFVIYMGRNYVNFTLLQGHPMT